MQSLVRLRDVHKQFANGTLALKGMNLEIFQREFVSFLGPSGCGKSTALRLIANLSPISAGSIEWDRAPEVSTPEGEPSTLIERRVAQVEARRAEQERAQLLESYGHEDDIGFVFQEPTLMPWATVVENVSLPLRLKKLDRTAIRKRVDEALEMVGLARFGQVYPRELSGGMKMRVSIARALVTRPRLLLMDEPFAALDEMTRFKLNNDLLDLWAEHRLTIIFVTHSVYESVYLSSRIVVMAPRPGRVVGDMRVDAPYPRDEQYRTSAHYGELCREVSAVLQGTHHGAA
jgi:NitT/TauT family transport system ATP-binding protein